MSTSEPGLATLVIVRHGETSANLDGVWHGSTDTPLTERGRAQAERVAAYLAERYADAGALYSSDLQRARHTAEPIRRALGLDLRLEADHIVLPEGQVPRIQHDAGGQTPRVDDGPWPQFPSDMMSPMLVLATQAEGTVLFFEKMFESRMYFVDPLIQMGANIIVCDPHRVIVTGPSRLRGQTVRSPDIRAGMALLLAALCAEGQPSIVQNAAIIDRGYERVDEKLRSLGADITREDEPR